MKQLNSYKKISQGQKNKKKTPYLSTNKVPQAQMQKMSGGTVEVCSYPTNSETMLNSFTHFIQFGGKILKYFSYTGDLCYSVYLQVQLLMILLVIVLILKIFPK